LAWGLKKKEKGLRVWPLGVAEPPPRAIGVVHTLTARSRVVEPTLRPNEGGFGHPDFALWWWPNHPQIGHEGAWIRKPSNFLYFFLIFKAFSFFQVFIIFNIFIFYLYIRRVSTS